MNDTNEKKVRCIRCQGRKKLYQISSGYSYINTGGKEVDCPMCLGEGIIKTLESTIKDIKDKKESEGISNDEEKVEKIKSTNGKNNTKNGRKAKKIY
jgi:hypothetical protein